MSTRDIKILFLITLFTPLSVVAQRLTIEECHQMALQHNFATRTAEEKVEQMNYTLRAARTNHLPNFALQGNYLYSNGSASLTIPGGYLPTFVPDPTTGALTPNLIDGTTTFKQYAYMPDTELEVTFNSTFTAGVVMEQPIYLGGKIRNSIRMAEVGVRLAELDSAKSRAEVINQTDKALYTYLSVVETLTATESYQELIEKLYGDVQKAVNVGMSTQNDLLRVKVKVDEAKLLVARAENGVRLSRMNLCYNIGLPLTTTTLEIVDAPFDTPLIDRSVGIESRTEYSMLRDQIDLKELELAIERSNLRPQLGATASYDYINGLQLNGSKLYNNTAFMALVNLNIPLFHWREGRHKVSAAQSNVAIAEYQFEEMSQKMELELMSVINAYEESLLEIVMREETLRSAEENLRSSEDLYRNGMTTLSDHMESQTLWQQATTELIRSRANARIAYSNYLRITRNEELGIRN